MQLEPLERRNRHTSPGQSEELPTADTTHVHLQGEQRHSQAVLMPVLWEGTLIRPHLPGYSWERRQLPFVVS